MALTFSYDEWLPRRTVPEEDVAAGERLLGVSLPPDLRAFLLAHDGPVLSPAWFPAAGPEGTIWCGPLASILSSERPLGRGGIGRACCLERQTLACRDWQKLPRHYVIIGAMKSLPSTLLISTESAASGTVYAWRAGDKRFRPDQLARVADSFAEVLGLLSEPPPEVLARYNQAVQDRLAGRGHHPPASEYEGPEARRWLRRNRNPTPLAANHFPSAQAARRFVKG